MKGKKEEKVRDFREEKKVRGIREEKKVRGIREEEGEEVRNVREVVKDVREEKEEEVREEKEEEVREEKKEEDRDCMSQAYAPIAAGVDQHLRVE